MRRDLMGRRIKRARRGLKLRQWELAKKLGKTRVSVANYELGRCRIPGDVLADLAKALRVTTDYLLGLSKDGRAA